MNLFVLTLPLMALGVSIAVLPLWLTSRRSHAGPTRELAPVRAPVADRRELFCQAMEARRR